MHRSLLLALVMFAGACQGGTPLPSQGGQSGQAGQGAQAGRPSQSASSQPTSGRAVPPGPSGLPGAPGTPSGAQAAGPGAPGTPSAAQAAGAPGLPGAPVPADPARSAAAAILGDARAVAIGDLDGDGDQELVLVDPARLRVVEPTGRELASLPVTRGIQQLTIADLDGDKRAEIYAGWGITREHLDTHALFTAIRLQGATLVEEQIAAPDTTRHDVTALVPMLDTRSLLLAYFDSKFIVSTAIATRGPSAWTTQKLAAIRMATTYARGDLDGDGAPDLVVGRVYGDAVGIDGDAFVLAPDGTRTPIPTTRGLRSLAVADADGDGRPEVFLGDGWHQNYRDKARGLLTWSRVANGRFTSELVEDTQGQYAIDQIVPARVDAQTLIVTRGNAYVRVFRHTRAGWQGLTVAQGMARSIAVGDLDGIAGDELVIAGDQPAIVSLRDLPWPR